MKKTVETDRQRWESRVQRPNGWHGCWHWTGASSHLGKGNFAQKESAAKTISAHRWAWLEWRGEIPAGMVVSRECETLRCVNPFHHKLYTKSVASARARDGKRFDPDLEPEPELVVAGACQHHWVIESPNGPTSKGVCRKCQESKDFHNSLQGGWGTHAGDLPRQRRGRPRKAAKT